MHDEDRLARGESRKPSAGARDLIDKTFAAGRPVALRRFPEFAIGRAEFAFEFVVTPSSPCAKILFAKGRLFDRNETQSLGRLPRAARRAAHRKRASRQSCLERSKSCGIAEIGRRVGSVNHPTRSVDRRMADQPEICLGVHGCASRAASRTRIAVSATCSAPPSTSPVWPPICRSASHAIASPLKPASTAA